MKPAFAKESDLCAAFIECLPDEWQAYPETGGFDIVLARKADGFQIGVEAKLRLNAKVITQAAEFMYPSTYGHDSPGPDCRAVLVPAGVSMDLSGLLPHIGITCIAMRYDRGQLGYGGRTYAFYPQLPTAKYDWDDRSWIELCPTTRLELPDWVPDVVAGASAPVALTPWKIGAIKLVITLEKRGFLTRQDFAYYKVSMSRWTQGQWLVKDGQGGWIADPYLPDFRAQHPVNFGQIAADYEKWRSADPVQRGLFSGSAA